MGSAPSFASSTREGAPAKRRKKMLCLYFDNFFSLPFSSFFFCADHVFGSGSKTEEVYQTVAKKIVLSTMDGMNGQ